MLTIRLGLSLFVLVALAGASSTRWQPPIDVADTETVIAASVRTDVVACWENDDEDGAGTDSFNALLIRAILQCGPELGLADAQTRRIAAIADTFLRETAERQMHLQTMQVALLDLLRPRPADPARPVDVPAAERVIREIARIGIEQDLALLRTVERLKAVLTPRQRAALATLLVATPSLPTL